METPLTPLEFARRARKLYPDRIAVIDGDSRRTYAQFLDRCDRWSTGLQKLGIKPADRIAYLSQNTHAQLESLYAVPQIGAGELLIRVHASGICGSDVMEWYRIKKAPLVLGHEATGEVVAVGEGVSKFKIGEWHSRICGPPSFSSVVNCDM